MKRNPRPCETLVQRLFEVPHIHDLRTMTEFVNITNAFPRFGDTRMPIEAIVLL